MSYREQLEASTSLVELWPCGDAGTGLGDTQESGNDLLYFSSPSTPASYQQTTLIPFAETGCVRTPGTNNAFFYKSSPTAAINASTIKTQHVWVNPDDVTTQDSLISLNDATNEYSITLENGGTGNGTVVAAWTVGGVSVSAATNSAVIVPGSNHQIVATLTGTIGVDAVVNIYVNGAAVAVTAGTTAALAGVSGRFALATSGGGSNLYDGFLQMVALFDAAVSSSTIASWYDYGINGPATGGMRNRFTRGRVGHRTLVRF